ncbi:MULTISPECIES: hypothetical protein [unclassified Caballeronia]|uniref:hypothetical protein n=1 Tax=unclassified Caballeronia TaxID=2646786 RepID=UPI0028566431|nr:MULTISPECIES: hypothetical protein [unclassified Caballeronia]MDR5739867.1 hypothetical protein [Caballeronia sp. LZ016]MDR5808332.1 hypothetical protein [Caballeronia sp. LZ019]
MSAGIDLRAAFRRIAEALESLSDEELKKFSDPQYSIELRAIRRRTKEEPSSPVPGISADEAIGQITALSSRHDAQALLDEKFPSKKALETLARRLDIPIVRQDKVDDLRDKIVEATVGARIRSQAIQGKGS